MASLWNNSMKKLLLAILIIALEVPLFAQKAGNNYIGGAIACSFGKEFKTLSYNGDQTSDSQPSSVSLGGLLEYGYFISDRIRLSIALGYPFTASPVSRSNDGFVFSKTRGLRLSPSFSRYIKITKDLYYTPVIIGSFELGYAYQDTGAAIKLKGSSINDSKQNYSGWGVSLHYLSFEFKLGDHIALGVGLGDISFSKTYTKRTTSGGDISSQQGIFMLKLNTADASIKLYLD